jgi:hypothetical protein
MTKTIQGLTSELADVRAKLDVVQQANRDLHRVIATLHAENISLRQILGFPDGIPEWVDADAITAEMLATYELWECMKPAHTVLIRPSLHHVHEAGGKWRPRNDGAARQLAEVSDTCAAWQGLYEKKQSQLMRARAERDAAEQATAAMAGELARRFK